MASVSTACMDAMLNKIATGTNITVCSAVPSTYSDIATNKLAGTTLSSADFTLSDGASAGSRKVTIADKNNINIDTSGTAVCIVIDDGTDILVVADINSQALTAGNTVSIPAWYFEIESPT